jgi:hypothetical protein
VFLYDLLGIRAVFSPQWFISEDEHQLQMVQNAVGAARFQNQYPCVIQRLYCISMQMIEFLQGKTWHAPRTFYRLEAIVLLQTLIHWYR